MKPNTIELTLSDGTIARWTLDDYSATAAAAAIQAIAGPPETMKC